MAQAKAKPQADTKAKSPAKSAAKKSVKAPKSVDAKQTSGGTAQAVARNLRTSPIKLNEVAALIRGQKAQSALVQLTFSERRIAKDVKKCLQSAIANAENNHNLDVDSLVVKEAYVGKSLVMKRMHTRARGRGVQILNRSATLRLFCKK